MIVVNETISFAETIQDAALNWIKTDYMPLLKACPVVLSVAFFQVETQQGADDTFALQIRFNTQEAYSQYTSLFQRDFDGALFAKFGNQFGIFKTILTSL